MAFPKIKLGSQTLKKSKFDLSHDVNTTADFGFVYPLSITEMIPNSSLNIHMENLVRLAPLSLPCFGRVKMHVYNMFVPISQLYEPFENLLSAKTYSAGNGPSAISYIPTQVPSIASHYLMQFVLNFSRVSVWFQEGSVTRWLKPTLPADAQIISDAVSELASSVTISTSKMLMQWTDSSTPKKDNLGYVAIDSADYTISVGDYIFAFKLSNRGRKLRSIFQALGYPCTFDEGFFSLLPLFAYYKSYYDLFAPQRTTTWTDTHLFKLMEAIRASNTRNFSKETNLPINARLELFIEDLYGCFFTDNNDFVSAHISSPAIAPGDYITMNSPSSLINFPVAVGNDEEPVLTTSSANALRLVQKLLTFRNIETNIGGRIKEYMRTIFGVDAMHNNESNFVGSYVVDCKISDVMNGAQTETNGQINYLGDYAGKGIGYKEGKFSYSAKEFGYFITMFSIVPVSNYFQGAAPHLLHKSRYEFYNPQFDSLGYELTTKNVVASVCENASSNTFPLSTESFGFIPRYMGYKYHASVNTGDISLRSMRSQYLGYSLDKFISPSKSGYEHLNLNTTEMYYAALSGPQQTSIPVASEAWRYINRYPWLNNFNRPFYNNPGVVRDNGYYDYTFYEDNFFLNNILSIEYFAPMKPASESFTTEGENSHTIDVVKA